PMVGPQRFKGTITSQNCNIVDGYACLVGMDPCAVDIPPGTVISAHQERTFFSFSQLTKVSGTLIVERRLWRTRLQSSKRWLSLTSRSETGCSKRRTKVTSTTQLLLSWGSGRGSETM